jgi:IS30 family transposase
MVNRVRQFTEFDRQRIREMLQDDLTQQEIARAYSVHPATISRLIAKHDLHIAAKPLNALETYIAIYGQLRRLYDEMERAYHDGDSEELARIEAEVAQLKTQALSS